MKERELESKHHEIQRLLSKEQDLSVRDLIENDDTAIKKTLEGVLISRFPSRFFLSGFFKTF